MKTKIWCICHVGTFINHRQNHTQGLWALIHDSLFSAVGVVGTDCSHSHSLKSVVGASRSGGAVNTATGPSILQSECGRFSDGHNSTEKLCGDLFNGCFSSMRPCGRIQIPFCFSAGVARAPKSLFVLQQELKALQNTPFSCSGG